ncbi:MAG: response regulator [Lachnospiraceae bacterium]|nr:response regulator [Lachnospiraceae bacterium]
MYKAIIADDEIHICMLLKKLVDWESMGIEIIGQYMDGAAALEAVRTCRPDIVITDIRMPKISGLDIVKTCNAENIKCIFLLLSGHAEFEYAHMALKYNVENYLLKPVNKEELENNLRQIITRLDHETKDREAQRKTEHKLRMNKELLKQQFLSNVLLVPGWLRNQDTAQVMNSYSLDFQEDGLFRVIAVKQCH